MVFEYQPGSGFDYMREFAKRFELPYLGNTLEFDSSVGKGFIKTIEATDGFRVVLSMIDYKKPLTIIKKAANQAGDFLVFRFYTTASDKGYLSNVQVMNNLVDTQDTMNANTNVCYVVISIKVGKLMSLLDLDHEMEELSSFTSSSNTPFLYQEAVTPEMKNIIRELTEHKSPDKLKKFYYKIKVSELIYEFFSRFMKRSSFDFGSANKGDIEKILQVERIILSDLRKPPVLSDLARTVGMSETKMKILFKKVFEDSIYSYYSFVRMNEAAAILKNNSNIPVSEVGYSLGFSNLSHFSKMFKKHIGMKPKEYALSNNSHKHM